MTTSLLALITFPSNNQITNILLIVLALAIVWVVLRFILRLTMKIFACGFSLILALGILLVILRALGKS